MPSPQELDRDAFRRYVAEVGRMDEARLSREVARMALICLTERDEYDVKKRYLEACHEASKAFPGLFERAMPLTGNLP